MSKREFQLESGSKMCHCNDILAFRPEVAKKKNKNETGIHPDTLLDL